MEEVKGDDSLEAVFLELRRSNAENPIKTDDGNIPGIFLRYKNRQEQGQARP